MQQKRNNVPINNVVQNTEVPQPEIKKTKQFFNKLGVFFKSTFRKIVNAIPSVLKTLAPGIGAIVEKNPDNPLSKIIREIAGKGGDIDKQLDKINQPAQPDKKDPPVQPEKPYFPEQIDGIEAWTEKKPRMIYI